MYASRFTVTTGTPAASASSTAGASAVPSEHCRMIAAQPWFTASVT